MIAGILICLGMVISCFCFYRGGYLRGYNKGYKEGEQKLQNFYNTRSHID